MKQSLASVMAELVIEGVQDEAATRLLDASPSIGEQEANRAIDDAINAAFADDAINDKVVALINAEVDQIYAEFALVEDADDAEIDYRDDATVKATNAAVDRIVASETVEAIVSRAVGAAVRAASTIA